MNEKRGKKIDRMYVHRLEYKATISDNSRFEGACERVNKGGCINRIVWHFAFVAQLLCLVGQIAMLNTHRAQRAYQLEFSFVIAVAADDDDERKLLYIDTDEWVCMWFDTKIQEKTFEFCVCKSYHFSSTRTNRKENRWWWFQFENDLHWQHRIFVYFFVCVHCT